MRHEVKLKRALSATSFANFPETARRVVSNLPPELLADLTSRQIGIVLNALFSAHQQGQEFACRAIIDEGAVWDSCAGYLLELEPRKVM